MIKKGIIAGYLIGLCSYVYSMCENKIVGAFLFGLGLLTICSFKLNLFTGMVGECKLKDAVRCGLIFITNVLGMLFAIILFKIAPWYIAAGIACGSLMQMAVSLYSKHTWATLMCVAAFLLSNSNHCIAMIYNSQIESPEWWFIFIFAIIGNIIGAKLISFGEIKKENI